MIECICDLVNINQLLSNESHDDFLLQLKQEKSMNIDNVCISRLIFLNLIFLSSKKHDESVKAIYFNRRYRALINSRLVFIQMTFFNDIDSRFLPVRFYLMI